MTRAEAKAAGVKRYFTGKPCKHGHVAERLVSSFECLDCSRANCAADYEKYRERVLASRRKRYAENPSKALADNKKWVTDNAEKVRAYHAARYVEHRDAVLAAVRKRAQENRDKIRMYKAEYSRKNKAALSVAYRNKKARRRAAEGVHTLQDVKRIRAAQKDRCAYCRVKLNGSGHVDHILALVNGGTNWPNNLQLLCAGCNLSKSSKHPIAFAQQIGLLL